MSTAANRSRKQQPQASNQQQNPQQNNQGNPQNKNETKPKQKKIRKPITLKAQSFQTQKGIKKLYQLSKQVKWSDPMTTQTAMNLVVMTLKTWQSQMMPKYYYDYFLQRCQALGSTKQVTSYMHKVRRIHKGLDQWDFAKVQNNPAEGNKNNTQNNQAPDLEFYQNYQDQAEQQQKFKQRIQLTKQLANASINQSSSEKPKNTNNSLIPNDPNQEQIDEMMDEDLRMFEQMHRKRNIKNAKQNEKIDYQEENGQDLVVDSGLMNDFDFYDD